MWLSRMRRVVEKNRNEVVGVLLGRYPAWVRRDVELCDIPVFAFHGVQEVPFRRLMERLLIAGYSTTTLDQVTARGEGSDGGRAPRRRQVVLTFDDCEESLFRVAYPILREYGLRVTAYAVPGATLEDRSQGPVGHPGRRMCTWQELASMHGSGIVDIQSHSMWHHSIAVTGQIVEWWRPGFEPTFLDSDLSPLATDAGGPLSMRPAYGTPIHRWGARYGTQRAFRESPRVIDACTQLVRENGGASFFQGAGWRHQLMDVVRVAREEEAPEGMETPAEQEEAIGRDLLSSREVLEARLSGLRVRHVAIPWYRGSPQVLRVAAAVGFRTCALGSVLPSYACATGSTPLVIRRMPPRFIWRLPGPGRRRFLPFSSDTT